MTIIEPASGTIMEVVAQNLNEMTWTVYGDTATYLVGGFVVIFMLLSLMKGIGVILRR